MRWSALWAIDVPGQTAHAIGFDVRTDSVLVADGWGVAFASLSVRRIDAATGDIRAQVRTGRSIRAFGIGPDDSLLLLGDKSIAVHDASTLERRAVHDVRVPRYANAIEPLPDGSVALMAPSALVAYELASGRSRKLSKLPAVALGTFENKAIAVLEDGSVVVAGGDLIGTFESPCVTGCIDASTGAIAALGGVRVDGQRSMVLHITSLRTRWTSQTIVLPTAAAAVGVVDSQVVTIDTHHGPIRVVAVSAADQPGPAEALSTSIVGFAGSRGIVDHSNDRRSDATTTIRLLVPSSG